MYLKDFLKLVANRDKVWIVLNDLDECNGIFNSLALDLKKRLESLFRLSVVNFENDSMMVYGWITQILIVISLR
jgi:hypothetical protein